MLLALPPLPKLCYRQGSYLERQHPAVLATRQAGPRAAEQALPRRTHVCPEGDGAEPGGGSCGRKSTPRSPQAWKVAPRISSVPKWSLFTICPFQACAVHCFRPFYSGHRCKRTLLCWLGIYACSCCRSVKTADSWLGKRSGRRWARCQGGADGPSTAQQTDLGRGGGARQRRAGALCCLFDPGL